jgi:hypothetical protein
MNEPSKPEDSKARVWERGYDDHKLQQLIRLSKLSLPEKLQWLEDAHRLVRQLEQARNKKAD